MLSLYRREKEDSFTLIVRLGEAKFSPPAWMGKYESYYVARAAASNPSQSESEWPSILECISNYRSSSSQFDADTLRLLLGIMALLDDNTTIMNRIRLATQFMCTVVRYGPVMLLYKNRNALLQHSDVLPMEHYKTVSHLRYMAMQLWLFDALQVVDVRQLITHFIISILHQELRVTGETTSCIGFYC